MNMFSSICSIGARRAAVADEIGAELAVARAAEGHVIAEDFDFSAVLFDDSEGVVGEVGLTESSSSMSETFVRPMIFSWVSVGSLFQAPRL